MKIIGVMSGTSYDAIDVAAGELWVEDDTLWLSPLGALEIPYDPVIQDTITAALPPRQVTAEHICRLDTALGQAFAAAAEQAAHQLCGGTADLVVCHGQTIFHWVDGGSDTLAPDPTHDAEREGGHEREGGFTGGPESRRGQGPDRDGASDVGRDGDDLGNSRGGDLGGGPAGINARRARGTLQLGRPAWIAERTGIPVISDLRSADIAHGGQGAPLVPMFDALLLDPTPRPRAALNLGGIANMTVVREGEPPIGYDIGPGNALIDAAMVELFDKPYDAGGLRAAAGRVHGRLLDALLDEPYYVAAPPKSTGKELFNWAYLADRLDTLDMALDDRVRPDDVVATVTELTARVVGAECVRHDVVEVLVSGGGAHNPVLMDRLAHHTGNGCVVGDVDSLGVPSSAKEAYAFAVLGWLTWNGLSAAVPSVTGARGPALLGSITPGRGPLRLPPPLSHAPRRLRVAARTA